MRTVLASLIGFAVMGGAASLADYPFPSPQSPPKGLPLPSKAPGFAAPSAQFGSGAGYADSSEAVAQYDAPPQSYSITSTVTVFRSVPVVVTRPYGTASYGTSGGCRPQANFGAGVYGAGGCDNGPAVNPNFGAGAGYGNQFGAGAGYGPAFGASAVVHRGFFGAGRARPARGGAGAHGLLGLPGRILHGPSTN